MNAYDYQKELDILFTQAEKLWFEVENYAELDDHPDLGDARDQLKWVLAAMSESARLNLKYRSTLEPEQAFWRAWAINQQRDVADRMEEWEVRNMYPSFDANEPKNVEVGPILAIYLTDEILDTISKDRDERVLTELTDKIGLSDGRAVWYGIPGSPRMGFMTDSEMEVCIETVLEERHRKDRHYGRELTPRTVMSDELHGFFKKIDGKTVAAICDAIQCELIPF